ncbi:hypothetical protein BH09SUM1_BH09SUM1_13230 [soil metagenome]
MAAKKTSRPAGKKAVAKKKATAKAPAKKSPPKKVAKKPAAKKPVKKAGKALAAKPKKAVKKVAPPKKVVRGAKAKAPKKAAPKKSAPIKKSAVKKALPKKPVKAAAKKPAAKKKPAPKQKSPAPKVARATMPQRAKIIPADERATSRVRDRGDIQNLNRNGGRTRSGDDEVRGLHAEEDNEFSLRGMAPENRHQPRNPSIGSTAEGPEDEENIYGNDAGGLALGGELDDPAVTADLGPNSIRDIEDELNLDFDDEGETLPEDDLSFPSE